MISLTKHTEVFGLLFVLLFFAAHAGFTAVFDNCPDGGLTGCAMRSCSEQVACNTACDQSLAGRWDLSYQADSDCGNVVIAGGLLSMPVVVEAALGGLTSRLEVLSCASRSVLPSELPRATTFPSSFSPLGDSLQHTVEKCVLNASFLI